MADKLNFGTEVRELKLGTSFTNNRATSFHTLKCDFKPASVDPSKMATVDVAPNSQVTVTVPHLDGSGVPQTVFKGNQRPYQKECVLIIDRNTGEMTLEKLSSNIQVKKTRQEPPHKPAPALASAPRPHTPVDPVGNCTQRSQTRTRVTSGGRRGGGTQAPMRASPPRHRTSPPQAAPWQANAGQSTLASLPMIGLDDAPHQAMETQPIPPPHNPPPANGHNMDNRSMPPTITESEIGNLTSSSGSSSSESDSDHSDSGGSDSEPEPNHQQNNSKFTSNGGMNGINLGNSETSMPPVELLSDDLRLSESGSDLDD